MNHSIFVISLARATDRRERMLERLTQAGVEYEIVDAVDGETLDLDSLKHRITNTGIRARGLEDLTAREVGCFLSHYNLWERIIEEQIPFALVLEDDTTWDEDFFDVAQAIVSSKWYWNVVHLCITEAGKTIAVVDSAGERKLVIYKRPKRCTGAYLIDLDGAEKMRKFCCEIRDQVDHQWIQYWKSGCYFYHVTPTPARPDGSPSEIDRPLGHKATQRKRRLKELGFLGYLLFDIKKQLALKWFHFTHPPKLRR